MAATVLPIPPEVWAELVTYAREKTTGKFLLHWKDGRVMGFETTRCQRVAAAGPGLAADELCDLAAPPR